jgi:regulator of protease activity HflC (stomatin/prohibitin superfamily)
VRTGIGGRKVVIDGGTVAVPFFHEISRVNMQTIRMDVSRTGDRSLITKDRMRVDVGAEFYASVIPEADAIVRAAQTLGKRTFQPEQLKALIEGMMVDALRSVAATMTMDELHENRGAFAQAVRASLTDTLGRYGLELDSVSLTAFDQTPVHRARREQRLQRGGDAQARRGDREVEEGAGRDRGRKPGLRPPGRGGGEPPQARDRARGAAGRDLADPGGRDAAGRATRRGRAAQGRGRARGGLCPHPDGAGDPVGQHRPRACRARGRDRAACVRSTSPSRSGRS